MQNGTQGHVVGCIGTHGHIGAHIRFPEGCVRVYRGLGHIEECIGDIEGPIGVCRGLHEGT